MVAEPSRGAAMGRGGLRAMADWTVVNHRQRWWVIPSDAEGSLGVGPNYIENGSFSEFSPIRRG